MNAKFKNSQIRRAKTNCGEIKAKGCERTEIYTCPSLPVCLLLKQLTYPRPRLPFSSVLLTQCLRASGRLQSGHRVSGTTPYRGHCDRAAEETDICASSPEKRERRMRQGEGKQWRRREVGDGRGSLLTALRWDPHSAYVDKWWAQCSQRSTTVL